MYLCDVWEIDQFRHIEIHTWQEAWGNKTKEIYYSLPSLEMVFLNFIPPSLRAKFEFEFINWSVFKIFFRPLIPLKIVKCIMEP